MKKKNWSSSSFKNRYSPYLIQKVAMVGMFLLVLLSFTLASLQAVFWQKSDWLVGAVLPAVVVDLTNIERDGANTVKLTRNVLLDKAAELKAEHMAKNNYFAHYSPEGVSPWYWFEQVSYQYAHAGENLAVHFTDSDAVVEAWMNSPTHRANIVNANYTEIGVGTAKGTLDGFPTVFVVQLFGAPAAISQAATPKTAEAEVVAVASKPEAPKMAKPVEPEPKEEAERLALAEETAPASVVLSESDDLETVSTYIATSSGLPVSESVVSASAPSASYSSWWQSLVTSPNKTLQLMYMLVSVAVIALLLFSVAASLYKSEPRQMVYGLALLVIMASLFYLHMTLTGQVVLADTTNLGL